MSNFFKNLSCFINYVISLKIFHMLYGRSESIDWICTFQTVFKFGGRFSKYSATSFFFILFYFPCSLVPFLFWGKEFHWKFGPEDKADVGRVAACPAEGVWGCSTGTAVTCGERRDLPKLNAQGAIWKWTLDFCLFFPNFENIA